MSGLLDTWTGAFCLTQLVEIPVYLIAAARLPAWRRWLFAAGASTLTHPVVWFAFPWPSQPGADGEYNYAAVVVAAETFAVLTEAGWGRLLRVPHPFILALAANAASVGAGFLLRWW